MPGDYVFRRSENGRGFEDFITVSSNQTTYVDTAIEYGRTYIYELVAVNQYGGRSARQESVPVNAGRIPLPPGLVYYYDVLNGFPGEDADGLSEVNLIRNLQGSVIGHMNVSAQELGINLMTAGMQHLMITRNAVNEMIEISVPTSTALAQAVNDDLTQTKKVPVRIEGLPKDKIPFIYLNGVAITNINMQLKPEYADYVRNISWNTATGVLSFDIVHFSTYSVGLVNAVSFVKTQFNQAAGSNAYVGVVVRDNYNALVENAPVVLRIESGAALFIGGYSQLTVTTNSQGTAYATVVLPAITGNVSLVSARVENVTADPLCQITVGEEVVEEDEYPYEEGGLDYDKDGLTNLQEYRRGTNPYDPDSDDDGVDDWHDGYPLDPTRWQYNIGLARADLEDISGQTYTGTGPNIAINSYAVNLVLTYAGNVRNGVQCDIPSITDIRVQKISGLAYPRIEDGGLGEVYAGGNLYTNFIPGEQYPLRYFFINRGNGIDTYHVQASLDQHSDHWSFETRANVWPFVQVPNTTVVAPWQLGVFNIVVAPSTSVTALEAATLNVSVDLVFESAVSYNAFPGAYLGGTYHTEGLYGGLQGLANQAYRFESEGNNIVIVTRSVVITHPVEVSVNSSELIPGSSIEYVIVVRNDCRGVARDVIITDRIPPNCHFYYTNTPTVNGAISSTWEGATSNMATAADVDAIRYKLTIRDGATVTLSYTVTVD